MVKFKVTDLYFSVYNWILLRTVIAKNNKEIQLGTHGFDMQFKKEQYTVTDFQLVLESKRKTAMSISNI